jgi:hypothetical protein
MNVRKSSATCELSQPKDGMNRLCCEMCPRASIVDGQVRLRNLPSQMNFRIEPSRVLLLLAFAMMSMGCHESNSPKTEVSKNEKKLRVFWSEFRATVKSGQLERVPDFVQFPMVGTYQQREELINDYDWVLSTEVQKKMAATAFDDLEYVTDESGEYWEFFYHNGLESEGQFTVGYHLAFVGGEVRIIRIFAAG